MALVQFQNVPKGINVTRRMGAPRMATVDAWYKQCRAVIPQIPRLRDPKDGGWTITEETIEVRWIKFVIHNNCGERAYIIIDRSAHSMGIG